MTNGRKKLAEAVIAGRRRCGLSQDDFAKAAGVARGTIRAIEAEAERNYSQKTLGLISKFLEEEEHHLWDILHPPFEENSPLERAFKNQMDSLGERLDSMESRLNQRLDELFAAVTAKGEPPSGHRPDAV